MYFDKIKAENRDEINTIHFKFDGFEKKLFYFIYFNLRINKG